MQKQDLLKFNIFIDNEYLDKYIDLITNGNVDVQVGKTNRHHIIPKYYFKDNALPIDNSKNNIVNLYYTDHIKAHYFLAMCSKNTKDISRNSLAIRFILKGRSLESINIDDVDLSRYQEIYESGCRLNVDSTHTNEINEQISLKLCGRVSPNKGNKHTLHKKSKQNPNAKNKLLSEYASNRVGELNPFYGKNHSSKTKAIIGSKNSKKVCMIDLSTNEVIKTFNSIKEAGDYVVKIGKTKSTSPSNRISRVCRQEENSSKAYGFGWEFCK